MSNQPIDSFFVGAFNVALWENDGEGGRTYRTVSLRKSFFNKKEDKLDQQTVSIDPTEVSCVIALLQRMEQQVIQRKNGEDVPRNVNIC